MSFASPLIIPDGEGADATYIRIGGDLTSSKYIDLASTPGLPRIFKVAHQVTGGNGSKIDRHLVSVERVLATSPSLIRVVTNFTVNVPQNILATNAWIHEDVYNVINFMSSGGWASIDALLRGET